MIRRVPPGFLCRVLMLEEGQAYIEVKGVTLGSKTAWPAFPTPRQKGACKAFRENSESAAGRRERRLIVIFVIQMKGVKCLYAQRPNNTRRLQTL